MHGIIYQERQDLQHLSMLLKKTVHLQLNKICICFITVLLIQTCVSVFVMITCMFLTHTTQLFIFHFLHENCLCGFVQINAIQYNTKQYNTMTRTRQQTLPI